MADQIPLDILVNIKDGLKSLSTLQTQSQKSFESISNAAQKSFKTQEDQARKSNENIAKSFNAVKAAAAAFIAVVAGRAVVNAFKDAVAAAAEEEVAIQRLNTALQLNGKFTEEASQSFIKFADSVEKSSSFTAEAVLGAGALLENLTALDADGLQKATQSAVNLSAALGKDLNSTTQTLARAINGNVGALKRLGIEVDGSGTKADRLSKILDKLSKFNGVAAQQSLTYNGALTQLGIAFDDVLKAVGAIIVKNPAIVGAFKVITTTVNEFSSALSDSSEPVSDIISGFVRLGANVIPLIITPIQVLSRVVTGLVQAFNLLAAIVVEIPVAAAKILAVFGTAIPNAFFGATTAVLELGKAFFTVLENIGTFEKGAVTDGLNRAIDETRAKIITLSEASALVDDTVGKPFSELSKTLVTTNNSIGKFNSSFVGGLEKAKPRIASVVDGFDSLVSSIAKGPKPLAAVGLGLEDAEESTEDLSTAAKKLDSTYSKFTSTFESLTSEVEKQGKTKQELADIEFKNSIRLANETEAEFKRQGKLTSEITSQIGLFKDLAAVKRDSSKSTSDAEDKKQREDEDKKSNDALIASIKSAFTSSVDIIKSGISQAFALGSAILDGQFFTELNNTLKSTILAPIEALSSLRELTGTFDALKGENSLSRSFDSLTTELPKFVDTFVSKFPGLVDVFIQKFPEFIAKLADAFPKIIDELLKALPAVVNTLADGFDVILGKLVDAAPKIAESLVRVLPRIIGSLLDGLTKLIERAPEILQKVLEGLPNIITAVLSRLPQIIRALATAIPQLVRVLAANLAPVTIAIIEELPAIVEALFETMIPLVPDVMIALVDALITKGGIARIVVALVKAAPEIGAAIVRGTITGSLELGRNIGRAILDTLKNVQFPKIQLPALPKLDFSDATKSLLSGAKFSSNMKKVLDDFIKNLKNALKPSSLTKGATSVLGGLGGAVGGAVGGALGLAKGGTVPALYAANGAFVPRGTDTVPAMLTPGELVIPRDDVERLSNFLDTVETSNPNQSALNLEQIFTRLERSSQKEVTVNIQVGEKQLSQVLLNLNRQGFRTA